MSYIMQITIIIAKDKLFLIKDIPKKQHIRIFNLYFLLFLGVFLGSKVYFTIRGRIINA